MAETPTTPSTGSSLRTLIGRISRLEIGVGTAIAGTLLLLVVVEPSILEAPFQSWQSVAFTFGGTALAVIALVAMLRFSVPPAVRVAVLVVPLAIVNWWLISPYFIDDVVDEGFATSISEQLGATEAPPTTTAPPTSVAAAEPTTGPTPPATDAPAATSTTTEPSPPSGPALLGAGQFVGLAGHRGTGDAGIFENPDGSLVIRFENFDIENGPDLEVYLVPGADQVSIPEGSIHLGPLKGNVGDQNYDVPAGIELAPGSYTVLVWCEAFSVEFVGATVEV